MSVKRIDVNISRSSLLCTQNTLYCRKSTCRIVPEAHVSERDVERGGLEFGFDHQSVVMPLAF